MTSKKSFLGNLIENGKRRLWLLVVSMLTFVLGIPTFVAMEISVLKQDTYLIEQGRLQEKLYGFASDMFSASNSLVFTLVGMFAVAAGIQGFSYLYDRNKIDFYHSKPIPSTTRFAVIWTNGILAWLVPYVIGTLLNLVFFAANGILDVKLFGAAWLYLLLAAGLYLCIYHLSILALMMTGKTGVTLMGVIVFLVYEISLRGLLAAYCSKFFRFLYIKEELEWMLPLFSPVSYLYRYAKEEWSLFAALLCLILFAAGVLALAYWCYKMRPVERAGSAMVFSKVKPIIKIAIAIPVGLFVGLFTCEIVGYHPINQSGTPGFPLFIGILGLVFTCCLIQVIYEADIKGMLHKKSHIVISVVAALCIALFFRFDLMGYDEKVPDIEDIEYAVVLTDTNYRYGRAYLDENMTWIGKEDYVDKYMRLTGAEAEAARNLMAHSIDLISEQTESGFAAEYEYEYVVFGFRLKNGRMFWRSTPVAMREAESQAYIEIIENSENYIMANEIGMSEELKAIVDGNEWSVIAYFDNYGTSKQLSRKQARELLAYYRLDLLNQNYRIKTTELPVGSFQLHIDDGVSYTSSFDFNIYPSYRNSVSSLKGIGMETEEYVSIEDVEKIEVIQYLNTEEDQIYAEKYGYYEYYEEAVTVGEIDRAAVGYSDTESMESILAASYPSYMNLDYWYMKEPSEENFRLCIFLKSDSESGMYHGSAIDFYFKEGMVPEFVKQDIAKSIQEKIK